ncbi:MAG TPA: DegT/DnrJ/EryC1/StrS aminotransferase family protein [Gammaproteobacteria bacterium]|nr:DegT/DnrJ/EryC1/StrS aminotransferase family protein [Gammaproteobacteria bacterium]
MFKMLRPVGNKIHYSSQPLPKKFFSPFRSHYYQSGTAALSATLLAAQQANDKAISVKKVLLPAYTCPDLISAARYANVEPVLIDFEPDLPWMNLEIIEEKIKTDNAVIAIIAVNFLGIPERIEQILKLIEGYNITLIEDSAQDFPAAIENFQPHSDFIVSSFGRGKPLGLLGGGIVLTGKKDLSDYLPKTLSTKPAFTENLKYWLKVNIYNTLIKPFTYYLVNHFTTLKLGKTVYKPLTVINSCPEYVIKQIVHNYSHYCTQQTPNLFYTKMLRRLNSSEIIDLPYICRVNMNKQLLRYPLLIKNPVLHKKLIHALTKSDLGISVMYKAPLPDIEGITDDMFKEKTDITNARYFASRLLTLPTHTDVSQKDLNRIEEIFNTVVNKSSNDNINSSLTTQHNK